MRRLVMAGLVAVAVMSSTKGVGTVCCEGVLPLSVLPTGVLSLGVLFPGGAVGCSEMEIDVDMTLNVSKPFMCSTCYCLAFTDLLQDKVIWIMLRNS